MGMEDAFIQGVADFSAMGSCGRGPLHIGKVLHKTRIEVAEQGAKAAAVTSVVMDGRAADEPTIIALDSPFLYLIRIPRPGRCCLWGLWKNRSKSDQVADGVGITPKGQIPWNPLEPCLYKAWLNSPYTPCDKNVRPLSSFVTPSNGWE